MAYIPPHRRISGRHTDGGFLVVPRQAISKWFIVPSIRPSHDTDDDDDDSFYAYSSVPFKLDEWENEIEMFILVSDHPPPVDISGEDGQFFSLDEVKAQQIASFQRRCWDTPHLFVLKYDQASGLERCEIPNGFVKSPWRCIAEEIQQDLVASFQDLRTEMFSEGSQLISPSFIVRFGTNLLYGLSLNHIKRSHFKIDLRKLFREHRTDIPDSDVGVILNEVIPKIGVDFTVVKEHYYVKVFDRFRKHANVTCKCSVNEDVGKCSVNEDVVTSIIELNQERHLVIDISYLDKKLDPRLMLSSKRTLTTLTDNEKQCLRTLVKSAIIDSEEMGGLRWPVENDSLGDRYAVMGVCHIISKVYKSSSMRLKLRYVNWFNFKESYGDVSQEVILEMTEIDKKLKDVTTELGTITGMVNNTLKLLWEHFL